MSTTETNRFGITDPDDPMVMVGRDHYVPLSRMTEGYVRQRVEWAAKTEPARDLDLELRYWADWLRHTVITSDMEFLDEFEGRSANYAATGQLPDAWTDDAGVVEANRLRNRAVLPAGQECEVCWLSQEIDFASNEYRSDWPSDLEGAVLGTLGHLPESWPHLIDDHRVHDDMTLAERDLCATVARRIADYRHGPNND